MRTFQQILEAAGYDLAAYSGRGMDGRKCLSVTFDRMDDTFLGHLVADVLEEIQPMTGEDEDVARAFRKMRTDSLGLNTVVYFPSIPFKD